MSFSQSWRSQQTAFSRYRVGMFPRLALLAVFGLTVCLLGFAAAAQAQEDSEETSEEPTEGLALETPTFVAERAEENGVYIASSREDDVDIDVLVAGVQRAAQRNVPLIIVVPEDPQPSASAFARRVQEHTGLDAAIVFPPNGRPIEAYAAQDYEESRTRALGQAQDESDTAEAIDVYVAELQDDGAQAVPLFVLGLVALIFFLLFAAYWAASKEQEERSRLRAERAKKPESV